MEPKIAEALRSALGISIDSAFPAAGERNFANAAIPSLTNQLFSLIMNKLSTSKQGLFGLGWFMKTTKYFDYTRKRPDRLHIKEEWIKQVIERPKRTEIQIDGRIRKWAKINEEGKYLRVILLEDGETVHNAFFDRSYKE